MTYFKCMSIVVLATFIISISVNCTRQIQTAKKCFHMQRFLFSQSCENLQNSAKIKIMSSEVVCTPVQVHSCALQKMYTGCLLPTLSSHTSYHKKPYTILCPRIWIWPSNFLLVLLSSVLFGWLGDK